MRVRQLICCGVAVLSAVPFIVHAQPRGEHRERGWHGDMRHFHERDFGRWRGGRWYQGHYRGRIGWWWIVGGVYYWYPRPVYPYPDPYIPPVFVEQAPAPQPAPPVQQAPGQATQSPGGTWYYCESAKGYYPYVPQCPEAWRPVPATPPAPR